MTSSLVLKGVRQAARSLATPVRVSKPSLYTITKDHLPPPFLFFQDDNDVEGVFALTICRYVITISLPCFSQLNGTRSMSSLVSDKPIVALDRTAHVEECFIIGVFLMSPR